jgi:hypothetical protein
MPFDTPNLGSKIEGKEVKKRIQLEHPHFRRGFSMKGMSIVLGVLLVLVAALAIWAVTDDVPVKSRNRVRARAIRSS